MWWASARQGGVRYGAWLVALALLGGCSVSREEARQHFSAAKSCCASLAELPYRPLPLNEMLLLDLNAQSPAFAFPSGLSYFAAFRLPPLEAPCRITVRSFALGEHIDASHIFSPELWLLDEDFSVLEKSAPQLFSLSKAPFGEAARENRWGLPVKLEGQLPIDDPRAAYLIILTTDELLAAHSRHGLRRPISVILPGLVTALPGLRDSIAIPHSPFGRIAVEVLEASVPQ